jgi:phosphoribosyl 1,2-cyclic phosphodiesterase
MVRTAPANPATPRYPETSGGERILKFCVLASSSSGNCTFIGTDSTRVLIDAGLSKRETQTRLQAIGESLETIDAILVTHEHSDHVAGLPVLSRATKKPIFCTEQTASVIDWNNVPSKVISFQAGTGFAIGDLEIGSFTIPHDAIDPVAYTVTAQGVRAAVVTDLGYVPDSVKMHLRGVDLLLFESNHNLEMLKAGPYPWSIKQRIMGRRGHLSNDAAFDFITTDMDSTVSTLILGHLSENTNYPSLVEQMAGQALEARGLRLRAHIAEPGRQSPVFTY